MPINLGQITFGIGADTTQLRSSIQDITNFGAAVTAAATTAGTAGTTIEAAFRRQEAAMISALQKVQRYQDAVGRLQAPTAITQGLNTLSTRGLDQLVQRMSSGQLTALQFQREMERFGVTMNNAQRIMTNFAQAQKQAELSGMVASLQKLSSAAVLVAGPLSGIATRISVVAGLADHFSVAWAGAIAGIAAGAFAFYKLSTNIISTEKALQGIDATLVAVYNSTTIANLQMTYLADLANKTGLNVATLGKQFSQFEAAAKGTSLEGERARKVFESIVFATQKLGLSTEEAEGALKAIQQMVSKGTIQMEELKGQLGDRLPGALQVMATALGVTTVKLNDMIKKGDVGVSNLTKFGDALLKRYNIDTSQKIDTIVAAEGRLNTARMAALDSLDKILGVSAAYKNTLNTITDGLNGASTNSREFVKQLIQVGIALAAAFAAPLIQAGITSMVTGILGLARAVAAVNAASALRALTSFAKVLTILAVATAAYYGSEQLIDKALGQTTQSFLNAKPAVEDYIKAQQNLVTSVRQPTREYLAETQKNLEQLLETQKEISRLAAPGLAKLDLAKGLGATADQLDEISKSTGLIKLNKDMVLANQGVERYKKNIEDLNSILKRQDAEENKDRKDPIKELTTRQQVTIDKAKESIRDLNATYGNLNLAPAAKEFADTQEDINHKIEAFKENLERAEIPAATMKKLISDYGDSLRKLKEGELIIKNQASAFQTIGDIFGRGMTQGLTNFVDVLVDGKDKMLALSDTAKAVAKDILNTFLKLAALNPLKNYLFGTNEQTLGGLGQNAGGYFGGAFGLSNPGVNANGSISGAFGPTSVGGNPLVFAQGGIMTSRGKLPLNRYANGGVARSPQLAMFGEGRGPEAYVPLPDGKSIPVSMSGGGGGGVELHIHEAPGTKVQQSSSVGKNGGMRMDVIVKQMVHGAMMDDVSQGGPISRSFEKQYGLNRTKGLSG